MSRYGETNETPHDIPRSEALNGLRILELADQKGEFCGKLAADMGADVIKVEQPGGDETRRIGPFVDDVPDPNKSLFFWYYNTSKRSITLNLEAKEGRSIFRQLVLKADILVETYPPGRLDDLGLGYAALSEINPRLIMVSITPFGQSGPYRNFKTSDLVSMAMGGPVFSCGYDDIPNAPPIRPDGGHAYLMGCYHGFSGMLLALYHCDLTGQGQHVDCSIHEACSCSTEAAIPFYVFHNIIVQRHTGRHASMRPNERSQYLCRDGQYVNIMGLPRTRKNWSELKSWLESEVSFGDLRNKSFEDIRALRFAGAGNPEVQHYMDILGTFIANHTAEEIYHGAQQRGVPCGIVRSPEETLSDPHLRDRGFFVEVEHDEIGRRVTYPGAPFVCSRMAYRVRRAPKVGEHDLEIYEHELGFSKDKIATLAEAGIV